MTYKSLYLINDINKMTIKVFIFSKIFNYLGIRSESDGNLLLDVIVKYIMDFKIGMKPFKYFDRALPDKRAILIH